MSVEFQRLGDVFGLGGLVTAGHQQKPSVSAYRVVHPVTGTHIDLELRHAFRQIAVIARVSVDQAINPHQHPCPPGLVLQTVKPVAVLIGLFDSHRLSVARRLHKLQRKRARGRFNWNLTPITVDQKNLCVAALDSRPLPSFDGSIRYTEPPMWQAVRGPHPRRIRCSTRFGSPHANNNKYVTLMQGV